MSFPFSTQMYGWTHYNYRWNSNSDFPNCNQTVTRPVHVLDVYNTATILADDASYGTNWGGAYPGTFAIETEAWVINAKYWAHVAGGNAVRHDGSGVWHRNFRRFTYPTSADAWPNYYLGWPCQYYWSFPSWTMLDNEIN